MSNAINIDFSALKDPDYVGDYVNAFRAGQAIGGQAIGGGATGGRTPNSVTDTPAAETPDEEALRAHIAAMNADQKAMAGRQADLLAGVGQGLKSVPYPQRPAVLAHMAPALAARGLPASAIAGFDPTDANLDAAVASARSLGAMLG